MSKDPILDQVVEDFKMRQASPGRNQGRVFLMSSLPVHASKGSSYGVAVVFLLLAAGTFLKAFCREFDFASLLICCVGLVLLAVGWLMMKAVRREKDDSEGTVE